MKKTCIVLIDCQNDFCNPEGSLFVKGAEEDIVNIVNFIDRKRNFIDNIVTTMDSHYPFNITNPSFWIVKNEQYIKNPALFTKITLEDVENGVYETSNGYNAIPYLKHLKENGSELTLWSSHCIINTRGWLLDRFLVECLNHWGIHKSKCYEIVMKGMHPHTDQYSIFNPEMEVNDEYGEATHNFQLLRKLSDDYDEIIFCGEASDICVKNSIKYLVESELPWAKDILKKSIIFKDCMSAIDPNFNIDTDPVYVSAVEKGAKIINSIDYA
ncbi:MAG: isochorismatase family protein [Bacilli bacterium]|nr:isochorismatase family protein [Bacilli bacterium]